MTRFTGKTVLITGSGSGIGKAAALQLAREGANVVLGDIKGAEELQQEITKAGGMAIAQTCDVKKAADIEALVKTALERFGRLDLAFNNAGIAQTNRKPIAELDEATWAHIMDTNLRSIFLSMKYEIPALLASGGGAIVNTSSGVVPHGYKNIGIYVASKAGVDALTRVAAMEYADRKIRINTVNPGFVATPLLDNIIPPADQQRLVDMTPLQKLTTAEDVAQMALFLLSDQAGHVTGQSIFVDGGINISF